MKPEEHKLVMEFEERENLKGLKMRTVYGKVRDIKNFFKFIKTPPLHITTADIKDYLARISRKGLSSVTYRKIISHIYEFYEFLQDEGHVLLNPAVSIERPKQATGGNRGIFTEDQIRRMLAAVPDTILGRRDRAVIDLLYSTGMRAGELSGLDIEDVNLREREIYVLSGKGDRERMVPVGEEALKSLEVYLDERYLKAGDADRDALFLSLHGGRLRAKDIREMVKRYRRRAGIRSRGSTHAFRHSCATHMLKNGAPVEMIRHILGHEYLSTTERYTGVSDDDLKRTHRRCFDERADV